MTLGALRSRPPRRATWYSERIKRFLAGDVLLVWMPNISALFRRWTEWEMKGTTCGRGQGPLPATGSVIFRSVIRSEAIWVEPLLALFFILSTFKLWHCFWTWMNFKAVFKGYICNSGSNYFASLDLSRFILTFCSMSLYGWKMWKIQIMMHKTIIKNVTLSFIADSTIS